MATYNSTTFGDISGRHGSAVAATGKRGNTLRVFKAPSNPKTEKQVAQRTKFAFVITYLLCLRELFNYTFSDSGGFDTAVSVAIKAAVTGKSPDYGLDMSKLSIVSGTDSVALSPNTIVSVVADATVKVTWNTWNMHQTTATVNASSAKADDSITLVFFNEDLKEALLFEPEATRADGQVQIALPDYWKDGKAHCWCYFARANGSANSKGSYLGEVQL